MFPALTLAASLLAPADSVVLRVLTINDFHGALEPRHYPWAGGRPVGGIAALKGLMDSLAAACRCPTLRLDAGDQLQGTLASNLVFGRSSVEALNLLGLDAAAIGNHELDWGRDTLAARVAEAKYPWLAANIVDSVTGRRPRWARPWAMLERGPFRIAVVGFVTHATKTIVLEERVRGLLFPGGARSLVATLAEVRAARPDLTILVAHEGAFCGDGACNGPIIDLARELDSTAFDLIVAGHSHTLINTEVRGVPIVQARANGTSVGIADLIDDGAGRRRWKVDVVTVYADSIRADSGGIALVERYRPMIEQLAKRQVARLRDSLLSGRGEYPLGNVIADAQRAAAPADFAIMNNGGIRRSLFPGPISYADLFELQPFGNNVVRVSLTGADLKAVLEHALAGGRPDAHVSGMTVRYDPSRPAGDRVIEIRGAGGNRIEPSRFYVLALSDFMAGGGSGYTMLRRFQQRRTGKTDLEAMIAWVSRRPQPFRAPTGRRWIEVTR